MHVTYLSHALHIDYSLQVEFLLSQEYPDSIFSLSCTNQEIDKICHDLRTATFSRTVLENILMYDVNSMRNIDTNQWIGRNVAVDEVLPEVYQVLNSTQG